MNKIGVRNKHKNKYGKLKTILFIYFFKHKRFLDGRLMKHTSRLYAQVGMQKWVGKNWETYALVVNWVSARSLLSISSMHEFTTRSIDFVLTFPQTGFDLDVFMELPLVMLVYGNRV